MAKLNVDLARRATIAANRRSKTRSGLLAAARQLYGREDGRATRVEDICEAAGIARGTFYNYFTSFDMLQEALFEELSLKFDEMVHLAFEQLEGPSERASAAIRFYLAHVVEDHEWGWGMVNTRMGIGLFHDAVTAQVVQTVREGIEAGEFSIGTAEAGRDIVLGAGLAAANTLLVSGNPEQHITEIAVGVLMALGVPATRARDIVRKDLPKLPDASQASQSPAEPKQAVRISSAEAKRSSRRSRKVNDPV